MSSLEHIESLEVLGHVYFRQGKQAEARTVFEGILALLPDNPVALKHLAVLALERGEGEEALRLLEIYAVAHDGGREEEAVQLLRVQALRLTGREPEAKKIFRSLLEAQQS
ncbi:MAG: tetratricopeptide repeat protein [Deltaproteobacteria bacterium]|jgi:Flp pilus assembly protein TadD|nr:tetratricopeptide repeat protein [Deltaproteobacteria bacterium]